MSIRTLFAIAPFFLAAFGVLGLGGCDGGVSTQEAYAACKIEQMNSPLVGDASFQSCVACYEQCGDQCKAQGKTPQEYACPSE